MRAKVREFLMESRVAGMQYHDGVLVLSKLKLGDALTMELESSNPVDCNAIALYYTDAEQDEDFLLGYIPRDDNKDLAKFLRMGYRDIFDVRISKIDLNAHYEHRLNVQIRINKRETAPQEKEKPKN